MSEEFNAALGEVFESAGAVVPAFPPGAVGAVAEWCMKTSRYPNVGLSLMVGVVSVLKLCDRKVAGPNGSTTVEYSIGLGPTGVGKQRPIEIPKQLLCELGQEELIGPGDIASVQAIQAMVTREPYNLLCVIDECGLMFNRLVSDIGNKNSTAVIRELNLLWGIAWSRYDGVERAHSKAGFSVGPALGIFGMSTYREIYESLTVGLVGSGFINRLLLFEASPKGVGREPELPPDVVPPELTARLRDMLPWGPPRSTEGKAMLTPLVRLRWGPGAEAMFAAFEARMGISEGLSEQDFDLQQRTAEHAIRVATGIAVGCGAVAYKGPEMLEVEHLQWGIRIALASLKTVKDGLRKYAPTLEYRELCDALSAAFAKEEWISNREVARLFGRRVRFKPILGDAIDQLKKEGMIEEFTRTPPNGGTPSMGWKLVRD